MKNCNQCQSSFEVTDEDRRFYDRMSPVYDGKKYSVPEPTLCTDCRYQRRIAFRNENNLYPTTCDLCKKKMLSLYDNQNTGKTVYCMDCWYNGDWDAFSFGRDFDFSRPFFEQFAELEKVVPCWNNMLLNTENSDYTIYNYDIKNCYMVMSSSGSEDCYYGMRVVRCSDCVDCLNTSHSQLCYECIDSDKLVNCTYMQNSKNSSECHFCANVINCKNCLLCSDVANKEYCILNQQLSKEEYAKQKQDWLSKGAGALNEKLNELALNTPHKATQNFNSENCTGDFIYNSKNVRDSFFVTDSEDSRYIHDSDKINLSMDCSNLDDVTECLEISTSYDGGHFAFIHTSVGPSDSFYCTSCVSSTDCFGSTGLHRKKHCILNKQYTKEEYEKLAGRIIGHMKETGEWGEFFPVSHSLFAYNETLANVYFPLTKEEIEEKGWGWKDLTREIPNVTKIIPANRLPDKITDVPDDILSWAVECEKTKRPFKIIAQELKFYRQMNLSVPHFHPDERRAKRMSKRNPRKLFTRKCQNCSADIQTTYSPDKPDKIYCESCYMKEVY